MSPGAGGLRLTLAAGSICTVGNVSGGIAAGEHQ